MSATAPCPSALVPPVDSVVLFFESCATDFVSSPLMIAKDVLLPG